LTAAINWDRAAQDGAHHSFVNQMLFRPNLVGHVLSFFEISTGTKCSVSSARHDNATRVTRVEV
jgi:hypothetical protein